MERKLLNKESNGFISCTRGASVGRQAAIIEEQASIRTQSVLAFVMSVGGLVWCVETVCLPQTCSAVGVFYKHCGRVADMYNLYTVV